MLRVIIADQHNSVREGLTDYLNSYDDIATVGTTAKDDELLTLCEMHQPNVLLMDITLTAIRPTSLLRLLRQFFPNLRIIILSHYIPKAEVQELLQAGASHYLPKDTAVNDIIDAIRH